MGQVNWGDRRITVAAGLWDPLRVTRRTASIATEVIEEPCVIE